MVDRGKCHFVLKALHAQKVGAIMLLVVDNKRNESPDHVIMSDDGRGQAVKIPTFLISWQSGQVIKEAIKRDTEERKRHDEEGGQSEKTRGHPVIIQANVNLGLSGGKRLDRVEVDLWYANIYEIFDSHLDLPALALMHEIFGGNVTFRPRAVITSCTFCSREYKEE
jgi:hypothetical protein